MSDSERRKNFYRVEAPLESIILKMQSTLSQSLMSLCREKFETEDVVSMVCKGTDSPSEAQLLRFQELTGQTREGVERVWNQYCANVLSSDIAPLGLVFGLLSHDSLALQLFNSLPKEETRIREEIIFHRELLRIILFNEELPIYGSNGVRTTIETFKKKRVVGLLSLELGDDSRDEERSFSDEYFEGMLYMMFDNLYVEKEGEDIESVNVIRHIAVALCCMNRGKIMKNMGAMEGEMRKRIKEAQKNYFNLRESLRIKVLNENDFDQIYEYVNSFSDQVKAWLIHISDFKRGNTSLMILSLFAEEDQQALVYLAHFVRAVTTEESKKLLRAEDLQDFYMYMGRKLLDLKNF